MTQTEIDNANHDKLRVLVVDDDRLSSHNLSIQLKFVGEAPLLTSSETWLPISRTLAERGESRNILAIAIGQIQKTGVIELLQDVHRHHPKVPLLLMTSLEEVQYSLLSDHLQAMLLPLGDGALNYEKLLTALNTARKMTGRIKPVTPSRLISDSGTAMFRSLSGQSQAIQRVRDLLGQIARRKTTVLVTGESGTGKEIVARNLHHHSGRGDFPFIAINCAAIDPGRHGAELFGQQMGYAGARTNLPGLVEQVDGGTLFLDEIADLPLNIQPLLLRFLEDGGYQRLGAHDHQVADVRVVVATRHSLEDNIAAGKFREDLYYRLSVMPVELPPLRERLDDIPELVKELVERLNQKEPTSLSFKPAAIASLQQHEWPGNVRELANLVERLSIINPQAEIDLNDLPAHYRYAEGGGGEVAARARADRARPRQDATPSSEVGMAKEPDLRSVPSAPSQTHSQSLQQHRWSESADAAAGGLASKDAPLRRPLEEDGAASAANLFQNKSSGAQHRGAAGHDDSVASTAQPAHAATSRGSQNPAGGTGRPVPARKIDISPSATLDAQSLRQYLDRFARQMLEVALDDCAGLLPFTAERLHLDTNTLQARMQQHGISASAGR